MKHHDPDKDVKNHDWDRTLRHGCELALANARKGSDPGEIDVIWELFREAVAVARSFPAPPRSGYPKKSAMPDSPDDVTWRERMAAALQDAEYDEPQTDNTPPRPSAAQISRAMVILEIWHGCALRDRGDWRRMRRAVFARAAGAPPRKIRTFSGMNRQQIHAAKVEAMRDMWDKIRRLSR